MGIIPHEVMRNACGLLSSNLIRKNRNSGVWRDGIQELRNSGIQLKSYTFMRVMRKLNEMLPDPITTSKEKAYEKCLVLIFNQCALSPAVLPDPSTLGDGCVDPRIWYGYGSGFA